MLDTGLAFDYNVSRLYAEQTDRRYPFLQYEVIGRTWAGRALFSFSLGNRLNSVLLLGGISGDDTQSPVALYKFIDEVCEKIYTEEDFSGVNISSLITKFGITVVPCLDPDGVEISRKGLKGAGNAIDISENIPCTDYSKWKANAAGTELKYNLLKRAETPGESLFAAPSGFCGFYPMSEPETRAFAALCRRRSFRSLTVVSPNENTLTCEGSLKQNDKIKMMEKLISSCGFSVSSEKSSAGFSKWFSRQFGKPSFEIGFSSYESLREALVMTVLM